MKIKRVKLDRLRNEEWFNLFTEFKTFVQQTTPEALDIEALFVVFMTLYGMADELLEQIYKSSYTALIVEKDALRDNAYRGISETVRTAERHYDPVKRAAAEKLVVLIDHYGNVADRPYNEETATIYNFIQDIRGKYATEIDTLDLTGWIDELERTNNDFEKTVLDRNKEYAGKDSELNMLDIRKKTDRTYLDIVERIEALSLVKGDEVFTEFIKTLNANIDRYIASIKRRTGKSKAKAEQPEVSSNEQPETVKDSQN
jgi:hypothetical protein